jgi:hypothetical protein
VPDRPRPGAVRAVVDEHGKVDTDLRRSESDTLGDGQRGEHVVDQFGQRIVEGRDLSGRLLQHRIAHNPDLACGTCHGTGA